MDKKQYIQENSYRGAQGELRWKSSNNCVPMHVFEEAGIEAPKGHQAILEAEADAAIANYKKRMESYEPSAEELFEVEAAFGPGTEVVNVITGKKFKV